MAVRPRRSLVPHFRLCLPRPPSPHTCRGMKKNALVVLCITAYYWHLVGCDDDEAEKVTLSRYQIHGAAGLAWERTKALEKSGQANPAVGLFVRYAVVCTDKYHGVVPAGGRDYRTLNGCSSNQQMSDGKWSCACIHRNSPGFHCDGSTRKLLDVSI
eukprot:2486881-Rhodomonas_salina.1